MECESFDFWALQPHEVAHLEACLYDGSSSSSLLKQPYASARGIYLFEMGRSANALHVGFASIRM